MGDGNGNDGVDRYAAWVAATIFYRNNDNHTLENPDGSPVPPTRTLRCTCHRNGDGEVWDSPCVLHQLEGGNDGGVGAVGVEVVEEEEEEEVGGWLWPRKEMRSVVEVIVPSTRAHGVRAYLGMQD
uniref:Uncharacterized protein n=1 Tax=Oryza punctata TaxID=4537 RepID=A0A0E0KP81_ORYPU